MLSAMNVSEFFDATIDLMESEFEKGTECGQFFSSLTVLIADGLFSASIPFIQSTSAGLGHGFCESIKISQTRELIDSHVLTCTQLMSDDSIAESSRVVLLTSSDNPISVGSSESSGSDSSSPLSSDAGFPPLLWAGISVAIIIVIIVVLIILLRYLRHKTESEFEDVLDAAEMATDTNESTMIGTAVYGDAEYDNPLTENIAEVYRGECDE
jgi:hypothetical protein